MTETPTPRTPPRMRPWLRLILGLSLALNLAVAGLVAGAMLRFGGPDGMRPPPRNLGAALYRELPRESRRALRADMARSGAATRDRRTEAARLAEALRAEPFDRTRLTATLEARVRAQSEWLTRVQAAWLDQVAAMSASERAAYADRLEQALNHRHERAR